MITLAQLQAICTKNKDAARLQAVVDSINTVCPQYGINTPDILHEFLANLIEESGEFMKLEENLSYSAPRLMQVWPKRFPTMQVAKLFEYNPAALAEKVYGGRPELGNIKPGDGWTFRGSGPIQITGRHNVAVFSVYMRNRFHIDHTLEEWAELLRHDIEAGMHSACWIFAIAMKLIDEAVNDDMITIVKRINGGLTNFDIRKFYYERCKRFIT